MPLNRLYKRLKYEFKNEPLLQQALSHCSVGANNNERLEFLGDAILSVTIANELFKRFEKMNEGDLSRLRAHLVNGDTLAEIASELELGDYLHLGQGELKSGGHRRASILSDALEAIFAAVYLDSSFEEAQALIIRLFRTRLEDPSLQINLKDPKTALQELLQAAKFPLPQYSLLKTTGNEHNQVFHVLCEIKSHQLAVQGKGPTRRKAEQKAAQDCLQALLAVKKTR